VRLLIIPHTDPASVGTVLARSHNVVIVCLGDITSLTYRSMYRPTARRTGRATQRDAHVAAGNKVDREPALMKAGRISGLRKGMWSAPRSDAVELGLDAALPARMELGQICGFGGGQEATSDPCAP